MGLLLSKDIVYNFQVYTGANSQTTADDGGSSVLVVSIIPLAFRGILVVKSTLVKYLKNDGI